MSQIILEQSSLPDIPALNKGKVFVALDNLIYMMDDSGVQRLLAGVVLRENGSFKGTITNVNYVSGMTVTVSGTHASVAVQGFDAAVDARPHALMLMGG